MLPDLDRRALLLSGAAFAAASFLPRLATAQTVLKVAVFSFPPFIEVQGDHASGRLLDRFAEVTRQAGVSFTAFPLPPARVVNTVIEGEYDVALTAKAPQLDGKVRTSAQPLDKVILQVFAIGKDPEVAGRDDLKGKRVIVQQGLGYGGLLTWMKENDVKIASEVPNAAAGLTALQAGRGDLLLHYSTPVDAVAPQPADLRRKTLSEIAVHVHLSLKVADGEALMRKIDTAIAALA